MACSHRLAKFCRTLDKCQLLLSERVQGYISMYSMVNVQNNSLIAWF